jgi:signal transduction histidine kinase
VIFAKWIPPGSGVLVNNFADWRLNGGPAGVVIFLIIVIQQAERKSESSRLLGQLRVEAAQSIANQDKLTERLTLIDMLTHELKNPLGTIRFALASLKRQTRDEESNERVSRIDRSVERMNDLIEHVAHSNRIDRFELQEEKEPIDAMDVIEELMTEYEEKDRFQLHIPDGAFFYSNRQMLSLMLANLIANAYKYDAKAMPIHIQVSSQADATVFKIVNSIDPSIQPDPGKFFQRYYRHDNVQSLPGMGIGLSLVESAALKIGAKVTFHIEATQVAFTVEVPL